MTTKKNPRRWRADLGREMVDYLKNTTTWLSRQAVIIALPIIATVVTSTRFTARKSLFLDRLLTTAEGGQR